MRRRRRQLSPVEIAASSARIGHHLWRLPALARAHRIAGYCAVGGEVDCGGFLGQAVTRRRDIYLPVIHGRKLLFAPYLPGESMTINRYGIPEPGDPAGPCLRGRDLDVVLAPLVAFDNHGHRIGMGGGYYDRSFALLARREAWRRPLLVGLAYEFQCVEHLATNAWDVSLHAVVTEGGVRIFSTPHGQRCQAAHLPSA